jgi:hypothetical protein
MLTEQRAINSNVRADGIEGFGAIAGIGRGHALRQGGRSVVRVLTESLGEFLAGYFILPQLIRSR